MENNGILEVFNVDVENISLEEDVRKESVYFKPRQEGKEAYTALMRFLPIPIKEDGTVKGFEKKPYYMKKRYWLTDDAGNGTYYDSPVSVEEKCPIQTTFFRLYNSDDVRDKKLAKDLNLSTHYWSLVYILDDKQNPDLVGKTLIWRYTNDIKKLIEKELNPVVSEYATKSKDKVAVWDLIKGKNLALVVGQDKVTINGKERVFPNYEESEFLDSSPLSINNHVLETGDDKTVKLITDLFNNVPAEMESLKYIPWTTEQVASVNAILTRYNSSQEKDEQPEDETDNQATASESSDNSKADDADEIIKNLNL